MFDGWKAQFFAQTLIIVLLNWNTIDFMGKTRFAHEYVLYQQNTRQRSEDLRQILSDWKLFLDRGAQYLMKMKVFVKVVIGGCATVNLDQLVWKLRDGLTIFLTPKVEIKDFFVRT